MTYDREFTGDSYKYYIMLKGMLNSIKSANASDLHLTAGSHPAVRIRSEIMVLSAFPVMTENTTKNIAYMLLTKFTNHSKDSIEDISEIDLAFSIPEIGRFRVNIFKQSGTYALAIRSLPLEIRTFEELNLPNVIKQFAYKANGLVLVTGPTGSGKSTTLAALINLINSTRNCHIITIEDPVEYVHDNELSIVSQREVGVDTKSFNAALRSALRQDPDVILVGEMRDPETISIALSAAETGHLVLSTLHTVGAAKTIDRIVDSFSPEKQHQIRYQLSTVLQGVVSQVMIPKKDVAGCTVATEIMMVNNAIANLIRENKPHQILNVMQTNTEAGMITLDQNLERLVRSNEISLEDALTKCQNEQMFKKSIDGLGGF